MVRNIMAKLEIKYSTAEVKKASPTNIAGAAIDPYYSSVAGAGFSKLGGFVDKIIKDTRLQNDKNKAREVQLGVDEKIQIEFAKYSKSTDPADINTFLKNTNFNTFKKDLRKTNKNVRNIVEKNVLSLQKDLRWKLFSTITGNHVKETLAGDQTELDKITLKMAANDIVTRSNAYKEYNNWFLNDVNKSNYTDAELKKLKDDKLLQAKRYQLSFRIKNDPFSILRNPKLLTDLDNQKAAEGYFKKASVSALNKLDQMDWDEVQLENASTTEKLQNFSNIITRMNTWKEDPNWRAKVPTLDDIHDMEKIDQLNSAQAAVLMDFFANPNKVSDQSVKDMINAQISIAKNVEDIDELQKLVNFDYEVASKLNIKDIDKYQKQFEKYKSDFPAAQEAKDFEEQLKTNMGKVDQVVGIMSKAQKGLSQDEKLNRDKAVEYYNDLVNNKKLEPSDAYIQSIEKFTNESNMPTIYNAANLTSINLPVIKADDPKISQEQYFKDRRSEVAAAYKDKKIDIQVYMEDIAALDVIEDLFEVRASLKDETFAFEASSGSKQNVAVGTKKKGS